MTGQNAGPRPPRLAEAILGRIVGQGPGGRSILGDAREELAARRARGTALGASLWYWLYVMRFAVTYGFGGGDKGALALPSAFRLALRGLTRRPGFSLSVVVTLGLGIGATTLGFALVDGVLLRPLPYADPDGLVHVSRVDPDWFGSEATAEEAGGIWATPPATFFDWERRARAFDHLGGYGFASGALQVDGRPVRISGSAVTPGVFAALGVPALRGRYLLPEDDEADTEVIVLSHGLWVRYFAADPEAVGRAVDISGTPHVVVGVMPQGFAFPSESTQFWVRLDAADRASQQRNAGFMHAVGRLATGVTVAAARADMDRVTREMAEDHPEEGEFEALVFSLRDVTVAGVRWGLLLLMGAALVVLLVGCANVTNLFLARSAERRREFAVHSALGAGGRRIAGLVLAESLLLVSVGGALGLLAARGSLGPFIAALPTAVPRAAGVTVDGRVALVVLLLTVALGLIVALLPAAKTGRTDLNATLRDGGHGTASRARVGARGALITAEVALAVLLLSVSGLFLESYRISTSRDPGFDVDGTYAFSVSVPELREVGGDERTAFFDELMTRLRAVPGVTGVALASQMPLMGSFSSPPAGIETAEGVQETIMHSSVVSEGYFEAMDIPVLAGRGFTDGDVEGGEPVTVVSEALAERYWPGESPIGKRVRIGTEADGVWHEVVGMAGSVRYRFAGAETLEYYRSASQYPMAYGSLVLEAAPGAEGVGAAAAAVSRSLLPAVPVSVRTLAERASTDTRFRWARLASVLLAGLGGTAVLLAIVGIYGVLSYTVVQRTRDIGIRVSLGGATGAILRSVLGGFVLMAAAGVALGVGLSLATGSVVRSALIGEVPTGPWILVGVSVLAVVTVMVAGLIPAMRALRVDPLVAFRAD